VTGFIYAIECGGRIKIGYSTNPKLRLAKIASDSPFPCNFIGQWPGTLEDEGAIHARFEAVRCYREWFAATDELRSFLSAVRMEKRKKARSRSIREEDGPLARWRKQNGLTQADFAKKLGVVTSFICQLERGISSPSLEKAIKIQQITAGAVPLDSLMTSRDAA
jgi:DNA-binding XRE family transcriptional regulator